MLRIIVVLTLLATPVAAQEAKPDKETICKVSGQIVQAGVDERNGGADEETAVRNVTDALPDEKSRFKPAVGPLVQWVYTLEAEELTPEAASSYVLTCLSQ